ncbi:MAG: helix-turn-helix domain-containing protein [Deltaproteobacteria bacterium]|nr:helix-turn-helix domain-containing protein [Deltaproteobacteria bacterium]
MAKTEQKPRLSNELMEAAEDINQWREDKITLKTYTVDPQPKIEVTPEIIRETRENLHLSRPVFAHELHVSPRTLEKWEQGRTKPNDQAATLIMLVRKFPDTLRRLKELAV